MVDILDSNGTINSISRLNSIDTNDTEVYASIDSGIKGNFEKRFQT
jgi:hypothetical protein